MSKARFDRLYKKHDRAAAKPPSQQQKGEVNIDLAMKGVADGNTVKKVLIPKLKTRIQELDEEEGLYLGTPRQFETRGRRLECKDMLRDWLKWSGQAPEAPDEGDVDNAR